MANFVVQVDWLRIPVAVLRLQIEIAQVCHHVRPLLEEGDQQWVRVFVAVRAREGSAFLEIKKSKTFTICLKLCRLWFQFNSNKFNIYFNKMLLGYEEFLV